MPEFRIRLEFDVEVDNPSHIDAAFAAADWLQRRAAENRFSYLAYDVAPNTFGRDVNPASFRHVDLEEIESVEDTDDYIIDALNERWHVYVERTLPDGRSAAWPLVVKRGDEYIRTNSGTGRIVRYADADAAQRVADQMNKHERNV